MSKFRILLSVSAAAACAAVLGAASTASAEAQKPMNAATTGSGTGCLVRDADGNYHVDEDCTWHAVVKRDKDGNIVSYKYQDKGNLPEDAPHPDKAMKWDDTPGCPGETKETTAPSGSYTSDCHYKAD